MIQPMAYTVQNMLRHSLFLSALLQQHISIGGEYPAECFRHLGPDNSMIDENHLKEYPYCGSMYQNQRPTTATSRIVNSKDATKHYRWVVLVSRQNVRAPQYIDSPDSAQCSGSVITER